ncbi:hypothetical protein U6W55_12380 [Cutibacterium acnes]
MSKKPVEIIAYEQIKKKQERFLEEVKDILEAVETHHIYSHEEVPTSSYAYNKLIIDDIAFVGKTVSELQYNFHTYGLLRRKKADTQSLNHAYEISYERYKSNFRFNPNDIDTYVEQLEHETSSAFDKASQEVEWS